MSTDDPFVYDKAKYHWDSVEEQGLPEEYAYHHTTYFFSWLVKNRLLSDWFESEGKGDIASYRGGEISINQLYEWWDACLVSDMLSAEGNAFARYYFDFQNGSYLSDYQKYLRKELPSEFHVPYTQENEVIIHGVISKRYEDWKRSQATFFRICDEKLQPLLDEYGLIRADVEDPGSYSYYTIIFQNETSALRVYFEWRDRYLSVQVCRLVGGKVQRDPESLDIEWTCFHVEDLLTVRVPDYDQKALQLSEEWLGEDATLEEIGQRLEKYADALRAHGGDVLRGDFSVFPELNKIAKQRAREREAEYDEIVGLSEDDKLLGSIAAYDLVISTRPEVAHLHYERGTAHHQLKQLDKAIADYDKAVSLDPTDAKAYRERGIAYSEKGEFDLALADFDRALALDPTDALTFNSRGNLYTGLGDLTAALAEFDRAITLNPTYGMAYSNRGATYSKLGDVPRAIDDYGAAIRHEPGYANSYANRAFAYYKLGEYDKGLADCERALKLRPDHAASYSNRGLCHAALGDGERATSDFQRALSLPCPPAVREEALIGLRTLGLNIES